MDRPIPSSRIDWPTVSNGIPTRPAAIFSCACISVRSPLALAPSKCEFQSIHYILSSLLAFPCCSIIIGKEWEKDRPVQVWRRHAVAQTHLCTAHHVSNEGYTSCRGMESMHWHRMVLFLTRPPIHGARNLARSKGLYRWRQSFGPESRDGVRHVHPLWIDGGWPCLNEHESGSGMMLSTLRGARDERIVVFVNVMRDGERVR